MSRYHHTMARLALEGLESESPEKASTLATLLDRSGDSLRRWEAANDADHDSYWFERYLEDEFGVSVRDDGLIEFTSFSPGVTALVGDLPVVVYHHTSDAILPGVMSEGIRPGLSDANRWGEPCLGVYVTTEASGPPVRGYHSRACGVHGGTPATLEVRTTLPELSPDTNDEDIASGAHQFVLPRVDPGDIL